MGEKIVVGPINKGLKLDRTPFVIDNDSFPTLINAYQWRGRVKRKRGTSFLTRLNRFFDSLYSAYGIITTIVLDGSGVGNLLTGFSIPETNASLVPGTITITDTVSFIIYTDPNQDGTLSPSGTINYSTGEITILAAAGHAISATFYYYPDLPVMGIEDLALIPTQFPGNILFDTRYSYNLLSVFPYPNYDVSFFKNPIVDPLLILPGYIPKTVATPVTWNGQDYQQFWTVNYEGALWETNGFPVPFNSTNIGMQFDTITAIAIVAAGPPAIVNITLTVNPTVLVVGDFVFLNEIVGMTGINFQTGYVIAVAGNIITVELPLAIVGGAWTSGGIVQYLTNRSDITKDNIRFYDGDPTDGVVTGPTPIPGHGWVNFMPPLSQNPFSIANLPPRIYYLLGAKVIFPFKDRLLFLGVAVGDSSGAVFYLQDTIVYSQNGTPYYTESFNSPSGDPTLPKTAFESLLTPDNQTASSAAWFEDQTGFGGFISAGIAQPIISCESNRDVLIVGFDRTQTQLVYSGNDIVPFNFYVVNSEYGTSSTFSVINTDDGVLSRGSRGFIISNMSGAQRFDLEIPDEVFEINLTVNGNERLCAIRDFINEWVYFTFPENIDSYRFPNQTLFYNYRDQSWAIFFESYTTYGNFRRQTGFTWQTVGLVYKTWIEWNEPWDSGNTTLLQQEVLAGNQQGFVLARDEGTGEGISLYIQSFSGATNIVTSPDHNLVNEDFIVINGALGDVAEFVNGEIFSVFNVTQNTFQLNPDPELGTASYLGLGVITRMYVPQIQTKQFPVAWGMGRKTRIGPQQYLLSRTAESQITLQIFLSQNAASAYNEGLIVPNPASVNNSLIYSQILYTCPESTNLGLTPANTNLQMVTAPQQAQIWHRVNTSLIGDTVQLGFTISDEQMRDLEQTGSTFTITGVTQANPAVITTDANFQIGQLVEISGVLGMVELNGNRYQVIATSSTNVTINVDSTMFTGYISGGRIRAIAGINGFAEVELHGFILDVSGSQMLC